MNVPAKFAAKITLQLDAEMSTLAARVTARRGVTLTEYATEALRRAAESDDDFDAFIQVGIDAADRGELVDHDIVMKELDEMIAKHRAR